MQIRPVISAPSASSRHRTPTLPIQRHHSGPSTIAAAALCRHGGADTHARHTAGRCGSSHPRNVNESPTRRHSGRRLLVLRPVSPTRASCHLFVGGTSGLKSAQRVTLTSFNGTGRVSQQSPPHHVLPSPPAPTHDAQTRLAVRDYTIAAASHSAQCPSPRRCSHFMSLHASCGPERASTNSAINFPHSRRATNS